MFTHWLQSVDSIVREYGYWGLGVIVMLESAGLPVPGETAILLGGAFAARGELSLLTVILTGAIASIIGDNFGFMAGHFGGRPLVVRYGARLGLNHERHDKVSHFFRRWGGPGIFVARFLPGLRFAMAPVLGSTDYPWHLFLVWQAAGAFLWASTVATVGYYGLLGVKAATTSPAEIVFVLIR